MKVNEENMPISTCADTY